MRKLNNTAIQIGQNAFLENHFTVLQSPWLLLSPYGDFPHARGLQRMDMQAANTMVRAFNSVLGRLGRMFTGVPFYIGHPDVPGAAKDTDNKAYGWIMELEARADGLYGLARWSKAGNEIIENAHYKFLSPYWTAEQISVENGQPVFRPVKLLSVGLTNHPNIPVNPIANSVEREVFSKLDLVGEPTSIGDISHPRLAPQPAGLQNEQTQPVASERVSLAEVLAQLQLPATASMDEITQRIHALQNSATAVQLGNVQEMERKIEALNSRLLNHIVNEAVLEGRLLPNEKGFYLAELDRDFENASIQLANAGRAWKTTPRNDAFREPSPIPQWKRQEFIAERMQKGMSWDDAWRACKEEYPYPDSPTQVSH